ncbi:MAG: tRNA pseudouridine(55) synthase TruB [Oscillospiraceae bacterium]|nr:tRNA pseudouridine(55) synthase TruB [Oscillospiraceae bacterium]
MANGILIVDKPEGWTSQDVCAKLRGVLGERRIGHGGTLDPMATGVLPVFVGRATRAVEYAAEGDKEYIAELLLGQITDTQDVTGNTTETRPVTASKADLQAVLTRFTGPIQQVPPMYSAIKVGGKKLYELARKGKEVERKPRPVTIHSLELLEQTGQDRYRLRVACSKGTYVRTLCHDIGMALGCGGTMAALRRTKAASFTLADATPLQQIVDGPEREALLLPVDTCFSQYPAVTVDGKALRLARNGNPFPYETAEGSYRVYGPDGTFLLLGRCSHGTMSTVKSFFEV